MTLVMSAMAVTPVRRRARLLLCCLSALTGLAASSLAQAQTSMNLTGSTTVHQDIFDRLHVRDYMIKLIHR